MFAMKVEAVTLKYDERGTVRKRELSCLRNRNVVNKWF